MPSYSPLTSGDPKQLGGLDIIGRLGEGGQGVVYLARNHTGEYVAVKWLQHGQTGDAVSVGRFLREAEVAQRVAPFCTAAVLGTGVEQDRPYIMSEYVEGPSLQQIVEQEGPRGGPALDRLAIGTATALAAIHQAGIVHRDFKPANVIIGTDGPRVIDFGIARALNATSTFSNTPIGTPAYMSPEQFAGDAVGPASDLFSWAGAMVFASCGRAPFGSGPIHPLISRVFNAPPDLGGLDGPLRDVVLRCLAKNPAERPTAQQVILRLLGQPPQQPMPGSGLLERGAREASLVRGVTGGASPAPGAGEAAYLLRGTGEPAYPPRGTGESYPPRGTGESYPARGTGEASPGRGAGDALPGPPQKRKPPIVAGLAGAIVLALVLAGAAVTAVVRALSTGAERTTAAGTPTTAPTRTTQAPSSPAPAAPSATTLPGGAITLHEHPSDPIVLTAYEIYNKNRDEDIDYARQSLRGPFEKYTGNLDSVVSPDGRYLAGRSHDYTSDGYDSILVTDRQAGSSFRVKTVRKPLTSSIETWSRDGSKILLNIDRKVKDKEGEDRWLSIGFAIIQVAQAKAAVVEVTDSSIEDSSFGWDGDEQGVVIYSGKDKLRFFDASGKHTRDLPNVGGREADTLGVFSPSGKLFATDCPDGGEGDHCIWDTATGKRVRTFSSDCDKVLGWYDESHLYCWEQDNAANDEIQAVAFSGKLVRRLLEVPDNLDLRPYYTINPFGGS
jgi:predicted Ser/Thr protein kinase